MAEGFSMPASLRAISALSLSPSTPLADGGGGGGGGVSRAMQSVPKSTTKLVDWQKFSKLLSIQPEYVVNMLGK
jgi:hypothetical protein